jgi:hypothetical protein
LAKSSASFFEIAHFTITTAAQINKTKAEPGNQAGKQHGGRY